MDISRRGFLAGLLAIGLAGCAPAPDPRMSVTPTTWARPPIWPQAATNEASVATLYLSAASVVDGAADWANAAAAMHAAHAATMNQPDPWGGFTQGTPTPGAAPADTVAAISTLKTALADATDTATQGLAQAVAGPEALLWASLLVCCAVGADWCADPAAARPPVIAGSVVPYSITLGPPATAAADALDRCFALSFALTTALGRTGKGSALHADLAARLAQANTLQTSLKGIISAAGTTPPPPQLSYPLPSGLGDEAAIRATWGALEAALGTSCAYLAGCQGGADGSTTATTAGDCWASATAMGQQLTWWPGWR